MVGMMMAVALAAAPMGIEKANAIDVTPARVHGYLPDATPDSQGVPSAAVADWIRALDREVKYVHAFTVLKNGRRIAEGAWRPYASDRRHALFGLSGVFFADLIGRNLVRAGKDGLPEAKVLDAMAIRDVEKPWDEVAVFRKFSGSYDRDLLWMNRNFTQYLGFNWEGGASAGDGLGRRTAVKNLALLGELQLRGGLWYDERLLSENYAAQYYRYVTRPSGLKVARGERGQLLMVSPKDRLVVAMTADTDQSERMIALTEKHLLPGDGDQAAVRPAGDVDLKKVIASLTLETCKETASPEETVPFNMTFDFGENRYGIKSIRLAKTEKGEYVLELGAKATQILKLTSEPRNQDVVFADTSKDVTALNGKYLVSLTGGFTAGRVFQAILYALDTAARFTLTISFADAACPVLTIARHGEQVPLVLEGKPAEMIAGVKRMQARAEILWTHPIYKHRYIGWPTVCRRKNGEVLAAFSGNREGHVCPYGRSELVRSSDNGETWSARSTIIHNDIVDNRDTGIMELANGDLVARWFGSTCFAGSYDQLYCKLPKDLVDAARGEWTKRSTDGGRTWEKPVPLIGHTPHGPIQLRDGRLLHVGRAATRWDVWNAKNYPERREALVIEESTDNARSWHRISEIPVKLPFRVNRDNEEPCMVECGDGRLIVLARSSDMGTTMSESVDGGRTWCDLRKSPFAISGHPPHLLRTSTGKILLTHCRRNEHRNVAFISDDDGRTWDMANEISLSKGFSGDMGYTTTAELMDGTFLSVYYSAEAPGEPPCLMATKWRMVEN